MRLPAVPSLRTTGAAVLVLACLAVAANPEPISPEEATARAAAVREAAATTEARAQAAQAEAEIETDLGEQRTVAMTTVPPLPGALEFAAIVESQAGRGVQTFGEVYGPTAPGGDFGIPEPVLAAYRAAEESLTASDPSCGISWWLLAGIGKVESGHAAGGRVDDDGRTRGNIMGPLLDGSLAGTAVIRDSDGGRLDGDARFDRAVGPMQFLPGTWKAFGEDGSGDGVADPHNIRDAALGAGSYLCASGADLRTPEGRNRALLRYNNSSAYVTKVLEFAQQYADGAIAIAPLEGDVPAPAPAPAPKPAAEPPPAPAAAPPPPPPPPPASAPSPTTTATPTPSETAAPSPTGTPTSSETPPPTETSTPTPTETTPPPEPTATATP